MSASSEYSCGRASGCVDVNLMCGASMMLMWWCHGLAVAFDMFDTDGSGALDVVSRLCGRRFFPMGFAV